MEVKIISDYLKANMPLPQYLPYARFLLNTDLSHTAKLLYTLLLNRATLSQKNNWVDEQGRIYVIYPLFNLAKYPLLIIDDFGVERGTESALEQIYNIIDSRYRSRKPLIVTTNLTLDEIRHPQDTAHARIYDRLLEMCVPVSCIGVSFRKETAQEKLERLKELIG